MQLVLYPEECQLILEPFLVLYDLLEETEFLHEKIEGSHESYPTAKGRLTLYIKKTNYNAIQSIRPSYKLGTHTEYIRT
jgi:hypothetical protein